MKKNKRRLYEVQIKNRKGITLIVLVITIIVLLILTGIGLNFIVGENSIIKKAQLSKDQYENAVKKEQEELEELCSKLQANDFPENTEDTEVGTIVKLPAKWATQTARYISTNTGEEITDVTKVATVYAVSVGGGESVPVPYGFYYVGGNLSTGVIISDNEEDRYEAGKDKTTWAYANGFILDEEGKVIGTNGPKLKGNQFVWISSDYHKTNWEITYQNAYWDDTTPKAELLQIEKYGGFYVARYEAGLDSNINEFTTNQIHTGLNQVYNVYKDSNNNDVIPQSKAGVIPWMFIDWIHSKVNAENMYKTDYVNSGLITGTQWDVILNTMKSKAVLTDADIVDSNSWGNYKNKKLTFSGRKSVASYNDSSWILAPFGSQTIDGSKDTYTENYGELLTTGASSMTEKYHIFDIAGNLWEWTEETSLCYGTIGTQYRVCRGGSFIIFM